MTAQLNATALSDLLALYAPAEDAASPSAWRWQRGLLADNAHGAYGQGWSPEVDGTPGDDLMIGTNDSDQLYGLAGNDTIRGNGGYDDLNGGDGNDQLYCPGGRAQGGAGDDTLHGSGSLSGDGGNDVLRVGNGAGYYVRGGEGDDTLIGGLLNDTQLEGGLGHDLVDGRSGNDKLVGSNGGAADTDTLNGGDGNDTLYGYWVGQTNAIVWTNDPDSVTTVLGHTVMSLESLQLTLGAGDDRVSNAGNSGRDSIEGDKGNDELWAGDGGDTLLGQKGNDTLHGGAGASILDGGVGDDLLLGGEGDDTLADDSGINVLVGGGGDDYIEGISADAATLEGGSGKDLLFLGIASQAGGGVTWVNDDPDAVVVFGNKTVSGFERLHLHLGAGNDYIDNSSNKGGDTLEGGDGNDTLLGGTGNDRLEGQNGDDVLISAGHGELEGGAGDDLLDASTSTRGVFLWGGDGKDTVIGGSGDDSTIFDAGSDRISTGAGDDWISTYISDYSYNADTLDGGAGIDELEVIFANNAPVISWRNDPTQVQQVGNWTVTGIEKLDLSCGNASNLITNLLTTTDDSLSGGNGHDTFESGAGDDELYGGDGNDSLNGGDGTDYVYGQNGADVMSGGAGSDEVYCGNDASMDTVVLDSRIGFDSLNNFNTGIDRLMFDQSGLFVGNGDAVIDGAVTIGSPGGHAASAELVVAGSPIDGALTAAAAAAAIGSATNAYSAGQSAVFAVHNSEEAAVYYFESAGNDAHVSAAELTLVVLLDDTNQIAAGDFVFGA